MQVQQKIFAYKIVLTLFKVFHFAITLCRIPVPGNAALSVALLSSIQFSRYTNRPKPVVENSGIEPLTS